MENVKTYVNDIWEWHKKKFTYIFLTEESQDPKTTTCERDVQNQNHPKKSYSFTILNYTYPH